MKLNFIMGFAFVFLGFCLVLSPTGSQPLFAGTVRGSVQSESGEPLKDAVIHVTRVEGKKFAPLQHHPTIDQKDHQFTPRILPVVIGTTVNFLNNDSELHNVRSDSEAKTFNIALPFAGSAKRVRLPKTGEVLLLCNVHPEMRGYILVLQNPYFAVSDDQGEYRIFNVPEGTYTLAVWHERFVGLPKEIKVSKESPLSVFFTLKPKTTSTPPFPLRKPEKPWTWEQAIEKIQETLFQALSAAKEDDDEVRSERLCSDAYFAYFEAKGMETAIRQNISSRQAFELEEMFSHIRREVTAVARGEKEAGEAEKAIQDLIVALREDASEMSAQGILGEGWDKVEPVPQTDMATRVPKPQTALDPDIFSQVARNIEKALDEAKAAYASGEIRKAERAVTNAYFEEFHRIEADMAVVSPAVVQEMEGAFAHIRGLIRAHAPKEEVENAMRQGSPGSSVDTTIYCGGGGHRKDVEK